MKGETECGSSPAAHPPGLCHYGEELLREPCHWGRGRTLRDHLFQLLHLADEETEGGCGLPGITLLVFGRAEDGAQVSRPQAMVLSPNQEASRSQVSKKSPL